MDITERVRIDLEKHGTPAEEAQRVADRLEDAHREHYARGQRHARCQWCRAIELAPAGYHTTGRTERVEALPDPSDRSWDR